MPKQGFKNQWIAISQTGKFKDSAGIKRDLNADFLQQVIANTTPSDAPVVIGHPEDNSPAWGWAFALRLNEGVLEAQFADTDDQFEKMVADGKFRKRSASFYLNPPRLRHVGFLGAMPPAIKGLRDINFSDGASVTVEISFSEENMDENQVTEEKKFFQKMKEFFGGGQTPAPTAQVEQTAQLGQGVASFSETDARKLVEEAVKAVQADFTEKLTAKDTVIAALQTSVNSISTSGKRAEIISFVEAIPAEKGKHFLKNTGIVEFLESLADADALDTAKAISFAEGEAKHEFSRLEYAKNLLSSLPAFISFGEKFGAVKITANLAEGITPEREAELMAKAGITDGGAK